MSILTLCIITSATAAYAILIFQTLKKNQKEEDKVSFSSFFLWLIIDAIMFVNTLRAKNDPWLIGTYTALTVVLTGLLLYKKQFKWNTTDTKVAILAFVCLVVSYTTGPIVGVTCAALSIACAGIPNLIGISKKKPSELLYFTIMLFLFGPFLSIISVIIKNGEIKDYIYPCIAMTYWLIALIITFRSEYK